jgi:hypothetical protein
MIKHIFWFILGTASVYVGPLLLSMLPYWPASLFWTRVIALLPIIIPILLSIVFWKKSKAFALAVGIWNFSLILYFFKVIR